MADFEITLTIKDKTYEIKLKYVVICTFVIIGLIINELTLKNEKVNDLLSGMTLGLQLLLILERIEIEKGD